MKTLRQIYLNEWRIWYSMRYKAHLDGIPLKLEWETFETWFDEVGERPSPQHHFCRDNSLDDPLTPWNETTAGWRRMPAGRQHEYKNYYATSQAVKQRLKHNK